MTTTRLKHLPAEQLAILARLSGKPSEELATLETPYSEFVASLPSPIKRIAGALGTHKCTISYYRRIHDTQRACKNRSRLLQRKLVAPKTGARPHLRDWFLSHPGVAVQLQDIIRQMPLYSESSLRAGVFALSRGGEIVASEKKDHRGRWYTAVTKETHNQP